MTPPEAPSQRGVGRHRWGIVALLFVATTVNYIDRTMLGLLKPELSAELGWSEDDYGNIVTAFQFAYAFGFLLMGCFVSLYNYLGYRLMAPPYDLRPSVLGLVFSLYVVGMWSSAWVGRLADRFGRRNVLWVMVLLMGIGLALTLASHLLPMMLGIALFTFGFFGGHSVASSWVGRRTLRAKALASAFYLTAYYLGSSLLGSCSGLMWRFDGWVGVAGIIGLGLTVLMLVALRLRALAPLPLRP